MSDGTRIERLFQLGKAPERIRLPNGKVACRDYQAEGVGVVVPLRHQAAKSGGWPMAPCVASGVHANQAGELREHFRKHNLKVEVTPDGDPIYESSGQRKRALACRGLHDNESY